MTKTKNASAGTAIPTLAVETGTASRQTTTSVSNDTTGGAGRQLRVADLLHPGAKNAIPRRDLMAMTGLSDRELRLMIQRERLEGTPICANNLTGYFVAADDLERDRFVTSMLHRAMEIAAVAVAVGQAEV